MPSGALVNLRNLGSDLTPALRKVADYVRRNPERFLDQTVFEVAEEADASEASVIRFCRDLGFSGFQQFKLALASDLASSPTDPGAQQNPRTAAEVLEYISHHARQALEDTCQLLDLSTLERAVEAILKAPRIDVYGVGASGIVAQDFAYKFLRLGYAVRAYSDPHLAAIAAATLQPGMVAIGVSRSGTTVDTVKPLEIARHSDACVIALTHQLKSPVARAASLVLATSVAESPLTGGSVSAKMGQLLVLDVLFTLVALRHPQASGFIARTAVSVADRY